MYAGNFAFMQSYRTGSHTIYDITLHIVWISKYRYPILVDQKKASRVRELVRQICTEKDVKILSGVVSSDHVHIHISIPPKQSISKLVMKMKGVTSRKLQMEFDDLKKRYWGQHFWARGYYCVSTGNVTEQMIQDYIQGHTPSNHSDNFELETL